MKKTWLIFTQAVTICLAAFFTLSTLKPDLLDFNRHNVQIAVAPPPATSDSDSATATSSHSYAAAANHAIPTVVRISARQRHERAHGRHPFWDDPLFRHFFGEPDLPDPRQDPLTGLGSGVIVSQNGYVLTNNHVIENASDIEITLNDGRTLAAHIVGTDPESDIAVLKTNSARDLPAITFSSNDSLQIGDVVLAIGNPFGVGQTVTMGIVSALGRKELGISTFENYIQTDAAINPGNSGGALVDINGNLAGINTAIYSRSGGSLGIGFAIPVSLARNIMEQIVATGSVTRGWIGVEIQELTSELAESFGADKSGGKTLIAGVLHHGPAYAAGVQPGDILLSINGHAIHSAKDMQARVAAIKPGQKAQFVFWRAGRTVSLSIPISLRPKPDAMR